VSTATAATAATAERPQLARVSGSLSWAVRAILTLAAVLSVAAIFAVWADRQLLDTHYWTRTNTKLLENRAVQDQLSTYLTEQLYANVDLAGELRAGLPSALKPLAAPAAGGLRPLLEKAIVAALRTSQVQQLWRAASEVTHKQFVRLIENKGKVLRTPGGGRVVLDLRPIVANLGSRFGAPSSVVEKLRSSVGEITILRSKTLETMQGVARGLHDLALVLPALVLLLLGLAIGLSRGRRSRALVAVGVVGIGAGIAALIVRSIAGSEVVDTLASTEAVRPAASATWSILTSLLLDIAVATIVIGVFVVLAGLLAGRSQLASAIRRSLAPYLRDRPDLAFGTAAVALLLVFVWGPIEATQRLVGIVLIAVLSLFGLEMLRRQTAAEFPAARYLPERDGLRGRASDLRDQLGRRSARLRAGMSGVAGAASERHRHERAGPAPAPSAAAPAVEQLERLAALHASGALTDEEFTAAKRELLPDRPRGD
jgi:putative oligomerization/nucleic acid binding protein